MPTIPTFKAINKGPLDFDTFLNLGLVYKFWLSSCQMKIEKFPVYSSFEFILKSWFMKEEMKGPLA